MKENTAQVVAQVPVDVATFLLNEKRAEVHTIEARFKVNLLLVPNTHLETPNYKVQRLRHDDLNQAEPQPASFEMVERPVEEDPVRQMKEEAREPRQEAVVKGITPAQPAPMPAERVAAEAPKLDNWLDKVLGWFRSKPAAPVAAPVKAEAPRGEARGGRGRNERDRRGQRDEHRGQPREGAREGAREGQRDGQHARQGQRGQPQQQRRDQPPREGQRPETRDGRREGPKQRPPREPKAPQEQPVAADQTIPAINQGQPIAPRNGENGEGGRRRERRRGGRNRGERGEQGERSEARPRANPGPTAASRHRAPNARNRRRHQSSPSRQSPRRRWRTPFQTRGCQSHRSHRPETRQRTWSAPPRLPLASTRFHPLPQAA